MVIIRLNCIVTNPYFYKNGKVALFNKIDFITTNGIKYVYILFKPTKNKILFLITFPVHKMI